MKDNVNYKKNDFGNLRKNYQGLRGDTDNSKSHVQKIKEEIEYERRQNDDMRRELDRINADLDHAVKTHHDRQAQINHLQRLNEESKHRQQDLNWIIEDKTSNRNYMLDKIADYDRKLNVLNSDIADRQTIICDLKHKIDQQNNATYSYSKEKDCFSRTNRELDAAVHALRNNLEDRRKEISYLLKDAAALKAEYHSKEHINHHLEHDIGHLTGQIDHLTFHNRGIGHEVEVVADREAYAKGNYCGASYLRNKHRTYEDEARHSQYHVDYVRAHSPARSPKRRYY